MGIETGIARVRRNRWFSSNCSLLGLLFNSLTLDNGINRLEININRWSEMEEVDKYFGLKYVVNLANEHLEWEKVITV